MFSEYVRALQKRLRLVVLGLLSMGLAPTVSAAVSCSVGAGVSTIGTEIFAVTDMRDGAYQLTLSNLQCSGGQVRALVSTSIVGELEATIAAHQNVNMTRVFRNSCGTLALVVHNNFRGTIGEGLKTVDLSLSAHPLNDVYHDVFDSGIAPDTGEALSCIPPCTEVAYRSQTGDVCLLPEALKPPVLSCGNPVLPALGCKEQREIDYRGGGAFPLVFSRYYESRSPYHTANEAGRALGNRWRHNHDYALDDTTVPGKVVMIRGDGLVIHFAPKPGSANLWYSDADVPGELKKLTSSWEFRGADDSFEKYQSNGRIQSRTTPDGLTLSYSYTYFNGLPRLTRIQNSFGQRLTLTYDNNLRLASLTDPAGAVTTYAYDSGGDLVSVTDSNDHSRRYAYSSAIVDDELQPGLLSTLTDQLGVPYGTWVYDKERAMPVISEHAGGVGRYTFTYHRNVHRINAVTVTNPLATNSLYTFVEILGANRIKQQSHPLLANTTRDNLYDANANLIQRTDYDGTVTTYTYDLARNLETRRVEASGTIEQRIVSTQWHPLLRLPSAQAEPGRMTYWVYDGQTRPGGGTVSCAPSNALITTGVKIAVVCERIEQATTDQSGAAGFAAIPNGAPRKTTYTYDRYGNVLTENGPRTDVNDLTTYTYYGASVSCTGASEGTGMDKGCRGQLKQVKNAAGHIIQYLKYNAHGQPLQVRDANGSDSTYTYDTHGRLTGRNEQGRLTTYEYDPRGLLTRIALPGGGQLIQHYDAAHRLVALADGLGNRIDYTLDAAGNRTRETVRDPAQTLRQAVTREFDALSRLTREYKGI